MFVARWHIDARFGHKQAVIDLMQRWLRDVGSKAGTDEMNARLLTGSIGAHESALEVNHSVESLAQLESFFAAIGKIEAHKQWGKDLEPYVVSGSPVWKIYRAL
jgi:hypothetical protein